MDTSCINVWQSSSFPSFLSLPHKFCIFRQYTNIVYTVDSRYLEFDGTMEKIESSVVRLKMSYEDTGSVVKNTSWWVKFNDNATGEKHKQNR
jgi:hypothetical protein